MSDPNSESDVFAALEHVERKFKVTRCIRQSSIEAHTLWLKLAMQIFVEWRRKKGWKFILTKCQGGSNQICSIMWDDNGITSHSKMHLKQMMRELIEEGSGTKSVKSLVDDTCAEQEDAGMMIKTKKKPAAVLF